MTAIAYDPEVKRLCERIQRWEDHADERDGTCVKCGETIGGHEPEHEPSPLCNGCAQDLATRTFPDQLEAAGREVERLGGERDKAMADASQARFYLVDANDTADIACADLNKHLETMTAERDALRAEVERLEVLVQVHPDDIKSVVDENDRMHAAFDQAMAALRTPGAKVSSAFCTWCGQHWPRLDGESYEEARRHTMEHAESCPANDIRIERDALRAEVSRLTEELGHATAADGDWRTRALTAEARLAELLDEQSRRLHDAFERRTSTMEQLTGDDARKVIR